MIFNFIKLIIYIANNNIMPKIWHFYNENNDFWMKIVSFQFKLYFNLVKNSYWKCYMYNKKFNFLINKKFYRTVFSFEGILKKHFLDLAKIDKQMINKRQIKKYF